MLLRKIVPILGTVTDAFSSSAEQHAVLKEDVSRFDSRVRTSGSLDMTPEPRSAVPSPDRTIGAFFDALRIGNFHLISGRHLVRTPTITQAIWTDGHREFNISLNRCLTFQDVAGIYTSKDGTKHNATLMDITTDLQSREGSNVAKKREYAYRVHENAQLALADANAYLTTTVSDYSATNSHDELRRLLAPTGQWVALMTKIVGVTSFATGLYATTINTNQTLADVLPVAVASAGLTFLSGIINISQLNGGLTFLESLVINAFTAWFRFAIHYVRSMVETVNRTEDTLMSRVRFPQQEVIDAVRSLQSSSDPALRLDALSNIETGGSCT